MSTATHIPEPEIQEAQKSQSSASGAPVSAPPAWKPLFSDSLLEVEGSESRRRGWSTGLSFFVQCLILGVLLIVPLMFTDELPRQQLLTMLIAPPPPPPPPPPAAPAQVVKVVRVQSDIMNGQLRTPSRIPTKVQMIKEEEAPPALNTGGGVVGGVPGGIPGGQLGGVIGGIIGSTSHISVPKLAKAPQRIRISQGVTSGLLVNKVEPAYPILARQARVQGQVVLSAIISRQGAIENLQVISGHPMLVPAAIEAVRQWRYRPYLLNGEPVEVETEVIVTFTLAQ